MTTTFRKELFAHLSLVVLSTVILAAVSLVG